MTITKIKDVVQQVAPIYPVMSIDLFGSYANDEATEDSDVDLLVYFDEKKASLFDLSGLKLDLQDKLNLKVDVDDEKIKCLIVLTIIAINSKAYYEIAELSQMPQMFPFNYSITHESLHFSDLFLLNNFGGRVVVARE